MNRIQFVAGFKTGLTTAGFVDDFDDGRDIFDRRLGQYAVA